MLKLNAGFSRKIGEPNYGSRGASVNVELELESGLIGDPNALLARINSLFDLARRSVDTELAGSQTNTGYPNANTNTNTNTNTNSQPPQQHSNRFAGNGAPPGGNGNQPARCATASQVRAIRAICNRKQIDADLFANERFSVTTVEELTLKEASSIIGELKDAPSHAGNGGGR